MRERIPHVLATEVVLADTGSGILELSLGKLQMSSQGMVAAQHFAPAVHFGVRVLPAKENKNN